jgi:type VI secretion system protein ImpC
MAEKEQAVQTATATATETAEASVSLLDQALSATKQTAPDTARDLIENLVKQVNKNVVSIDKDVIRTLEKGIAGIDAVISRQLAAIMHAPKFQKLEGSWQGLRHLVMNTETSAQLKLRVLNCSKKELQKDLERAVEFDQSETFKKLYTAEFDQAGGEPYGAVVGDYEFTNHPDDIGILQGMSNIAAAGFCPFLAAADPALFGFDSWTDLMKPRDLEKIFEDVAYTKWKSFRDSEDSRFTVLTMPRTLARLPYGANTKPIEEFAFEEVRLDADGKPISVDHSEYCWMNTSYVMGAKFTDAFAKTGFCTAIRGVENGGKVEDLPTHIFTSDDGDSDLKCPTEIPISDRREAELSKLGFLPLLHFKNTDYSVFFGAQTTQKPKKYDRHAATENAAISARLPYLMACSRFSHYLKVMARDKIGAFMEAEDCEAWLDRWIKNYVSTNNPSPEVKARFPLADAQVKVEPVPGNPGAYNATVWMRPWLQLEELTASMRMVARIPKPGGG